MFRLNNASLFTTSVKLSSDNEVMNAPENAEVCRDEARIRIYFALCLEPVRGIPSLAEEPCLSCVHW